MNNIVFRTADKNGLCAASHVLYDNSPFFDDTLDYDHSIRDVYIETTTYEFDHSRRDDLRDFSSTARRFSYVPFAYGGTSKWSSTETWQIDAFVQAVLRFNNQYDQAAFRGVCLDIQPGELRGSNEVQCKLLDNYIRVLASTFHNIKVYNAFHNRDFQLKVVMPHHLYKFANLDGDGYLSQFQNACHEVIRVDYVD